MSDVTNNQGWVSVGIDHDTAYFATAGIRRWWQEMGQARFPRAERLLMCADGGGGNSHGPRLWKAAWQELADDADLALTVSHIPPGARKWNKVEHRLYSFITSDGRGKPRVSRQVIVKLMANATTTKGLIVKAALDEATYETGVKITDEQRAGLRIAPAKFQGEWNSTITPRRKS